MKIDAANHLTDHELTVELGRLAAREREATVALIVHLGEFDARRLYEPAGFGSMFKYCRAVLHLSEGATYNRIEAARAARRHPVIVEMLTDGRLSPTTARLLARHLTAENENELLAAAAGKGRDDVEEMLADLRPRSDIRPSVRKVPAGSVQTSPAPGASIPLPQLEPPRTTAELILMSSPSSRPAAICPLGLERYEFRFMGSAGTAGEVAHGSGPPRTRRPQRRSGRDRRQGSDAAHRGTVQAQVRGHRSPT